MAFSTLFTVSLACVVISLQGCATATGTTAAAGEPAIPIPAADPALDHYIAWIPRAQAQTPTIAKTLTHITLGNAKEQAARQLCAGAWLLDGRVTERVGPLPVTAPQARGGYPAWYYRISHQPGLRGCSAATEKQIYQSLASHLPGWLSVRPAQQQAVSTITRVE